MCPSWALSTPPPQCWGPCGPGKPSEGQSVPVCAHESGPAPLHTRGAHRSPVHCLFTGGPRIGLPRPALALEHVMEDQLRGEGAPKHGSSDQVHRTAEAPDWKTPEPSTPYLGRSRVGSAPRPGSVSYPRPSIQIDVALDSIWLRQEDTSMDLRTVPPGTR